MSRFLVPPEVMDAAQEELRRRLSAEKPSAVDEQRLRLRNRLTKLAELYSWDDLTEVDYRREKREVEARLAALPDNDELALFERHRTIAASLSEAIAKASGDQLKALVAMMVERIDTAHQVVTRITWTPPALPFFDQASIADDSTRTALFWRPRTDSNRRRAP